MTSTRPSFLIPAILCAALFALVTPCDPAKAIEVLPTANDDHIRFQTEVEDWVQTRTARVVIAANLGVSPNGLAKGRDETLGILRRLSKDAIWRLSGIERLGNQAGFERWRLTAETRLASDQLASLDQRLKNANRPGLALSVQLIDHAPGLAERRAVLAELRGRIYKLAAEELGRVNAAFPDRRYRIGAIDFHGPAPVAARPKMLRSAAITTSTANADPSHSGAVARKARLTAQITLVAIRPDR